MQLGQTSNRQTGSVPARCLQPLGTLAHRAAAWFHIICAVIWLFIAVNGQAQGLGRPDLLNSDNLPSGDGATIEIGASRARFIRINAPVLTAPDSPLHQPFVAW